MVHRRGFEPLAPGTQCRIEGQEKDGGGRPFGVIYLHSRRSTSLGYGLRALGYAVLSSMAITIVTFGLLIAWMEQIPVGRTLELTGSCG